MQTPGNGFAFRAAARPRRLSLTPLVDVVFILLLFFMLTSRFEHWQGLTVDTAPPPARAADQMTADAAVLHFSADGALSLDDRSLTLRQLTRALRLRIETDADLKVFIVLGSGLNVQELMQVVDVVRAAGVRTLSVGRQ